MLFWESAVLQEKFDIFLKQFFPPNILKHGQRSNLKFTICKQSGQCALCFVSYLSESEICGTAHLGHEEIETDLRPFQIAKVEGGTGGLLILLSSLECNACCLMVD